MTNEPKTQEKPSAHIETESADNLLAVLRASEANVLTKLNEFNTKVNELATLLENARGAIAEVSDPFLHPSRLANGCPYQCQ